MELKQYDVLTFSQYEGGLDALVSAVNAAMADGWRPLGGVFVVFIADNNGNIHYKTTEYYQAMVREGGDSK